MGKEEEGGARTPSSQPGLRKRKAIAVLADKDKLLLRMRDLTIWRMSADNNF